MAPWYPWVRGSRSQNRGVPGYLTIEIARLGRFQVTGLDLSRRSWRSRARTLGRRRYGTGAHGRCGVPKRSCGADLQITATRANCRQVNGVVSRPDPGRRPGCGITINFHAMRRQEKNESLPAARNPKTCDSPDERHRCGQCNSRFKSQAQMRSVTRSPWRIEGSGE